MPARKDLTNQVFNTYKCIKPATSKNGKSYWLCECIYCGQQKEIQTNHILYANIKTVGCFCEGASQYLNENTNFNFFRKCAICGKEFKITKISQNTRRYCYECSPPEKGSNYTYRLHSMKHQVILMRGGKCERCGYDKCEDALCFHHRDPSTKKFQLSMQSGSTKWEDYLEESKKCDLLCLNCHAEEHKRLRENNNN